MATLRAGDLRERLVFLTPTRADDRGFATVTYSTAFAVWAAVRLRGGSNENTQDRRDSKLAIECDLRYRSDITMDMRFVWRGKTFELTDPAQIVPVEGRMTISALEDESQSLAVDHLAVDPDVLFMTVGESFALTAVVYDALANPLTGRFFTWTSNDPSIISIDGTGLATSHALGTCTITVSCEGKTVTVPSTVTVPLTLTLDWAPLVRRRDLSQPVVLVSNTGQTGAQDAIPAHLGAGQLNTGGGEARVPVLKSADEWGFCAPVDAAMASDLSPDTFHAASNVVVDGPYQNTAARSIVPSVSADFYCSLDMRWHPLSSSDNQDLTAFKRSLACALIARTSGDVGKTVRVWLMDQAALPGGAGWSGGVVTLKHVDVVLRHHLGEIDSTAATADLWEHVALTFDSYAQIAGLVSVPTLVVTMVPSSGQIVGFAAAPYTHHAWQDEDAGDETNWLRPVPFHETLGVQTTDIVCNAWSEDSDDPTIYGGGVKTPTAVVARDSDRYYGGRTLKQFTLGVGDGITTAATIRLEDGGDNPPSQSNIPVTSAWGHWYIEPAAGVALPGDGALALYLSTVGTLGNDTFTRADSSTLDNAESGQTWVNGNLWGIASSKAKSVGPAEHPAVIDCGASDGTVQCDFSGAGLGSTFNPWLVFRYTDDSNFLFVSAQSSTTVELYTFIGGSFTQIGTAAYSWVGGETVSAVLSGSSIIVSVNGVQKITATSTANQTATFHGFNGSSVAGSACRWDNFKFTGGNTTFGPFPLVSDETRYGLVTRPGPLVRANGGQFFRTRATFNLADEGYLDFTPRIVNVSTGPLVFNATRAAVTTEDGRDLGIHNAWVPKRTITGRQFADSAFEIFLNIQKFLTPSTLLWVMRQVVPWSFGDLADINGAGADSYIPSLWQSGPYGSADYAFKCDVNQHGDGTFTIDVTVGRGFPTANPDTFMNWSIQLQNASLAQAAIAWPKFVAFDMAVVAQNGAPLAFGIGLGTGRGMQWLSHGDSFLGGTVVFSSGVGTAWTFDADGIPGPDFGHMGIGADLDRVRQTNGWFQAIAASTTIAPATVKDSIGYQIARVFGARKDHR